MKEQEEHEDENAASDSSEETSQEPCPSSIETNESFEKTDSYVENVYTHPRQNFQHQRKGPQSHSYHNANPEKIDVLLSDLLTFKSQPPRTKVAADSKSHHHGDTIDMSKKDHIVFVEREASSIHVPTNQISDGACGDVMQLESNSDINWADTMINADLEQSGGDFEQPKPKGTEIRFKGLELYENTSTLRTDAVVLAVECSKCKTKTDIKADKIRYCTKD